MRKYQCDGCEKTFKRNQDLKKHVETIHNGKRFDCSLCENSYKSPKHSDHHLSGRWK